MEKGYFNRFIKNQYFGHLLTDESILGLAEEFSLQELKTGLVYANKVIYKRINSINYLIKSIRTGVEEANLSTARKLERLYKASETEYSYSEIYEAYMRAEEEGLNLSCLKMNLLVNTLEYGGFL
jgi:hypothetical protein